MSTDFTLQLLDPLTDLALYREAYNWRNDHRRVLPDRMPFESFTDPDALAVGLFDGELQAVYFLHEVEPRKFQSHFTSRRNVSRETLLVGAAEVAYQVLTNGAEEIEAWVTPRNKPLRSFLESLGFTCVTVQHFPCADVSNGSTLSAEPRNQRREFVKYVLKAEAIGPLGQKTGFDAIRNHE